MGSTTLPVRPSVMMCRRAREPARRLSRRAREARRV